MLAKRIDRISQPLCCHLRQQLVTDSVNPGIRLLLKLRRHRMGGQTGRLNLSGNLPGQLANRLQHP